MKKMTLTWNGAVSIMDSFALLYICAHGAVQGIDETGDPIIADEHIIKAEEYAREKFCEVCDEWEQIMGMPWEVEDPKE